MSTMPDLVPCHCKKCNGILRKRRTQQAHRAAEKRQEESSSGSTSRFDEWFKVHGKNFRDDPAQKFARDLANGDDESMVSDTNSEGSSDSERRPTKRIKTLSMLQEPSVAPGVTNPDAQSEASNPSIIDHENDHVEDFPSPSNDVELHQEVLPWSEDARNTALNDKSVETTEDEDDDDEDDDESDEDDEDKVARAELIAQLNAIPDPQPFSEEGDFDSNVDGPVSSIENVSFTQHLIHELKRATLDNDKLDREAVRRLQNPDPPVDFGDDADVRLSLDLFIACNNASQATYSAVREAIMRRCPEMEVLSYYKVKKLVSKMSGVDSVLDDMCINSCAAFVGPLANLTECPECGQPRYKPTKSGKKIPRQQVCTIPLGPQLQALRQSPEGAAALRYRDNKMREVLRAYDSTPLVDRVYDDLFCGSDLRNLVTNPQIALSVNDITVSFSLDGAQLYQNKKSDTWIGIWIINDYNPNTRYRKKHVLPALVVPGPNKPKNLDSFLFRGFYHLAALQHENKGCGMRTWNAVQKEIVLSRVFLVFATADALGLPELDGRVGHHGAHGCRMGCDMKGRHKPSSGHYCAAHLRPDGYDNESCNHPDYDFGRNPVALSPQMYNENLAKVVNSQDQVTYERNRKLTGISKPSILTGLDQRLMLPVPRCFTVDLMHLAFLNLGELLIPLWRGSLRCDPTDDKSMWPWATLVGKTWTEHGKLVAESTQYFPSLFHRPPRNPAEKISSGYKATEYFLYLFGLGPGFFRVILPKVYWKNFCKLVHGVRIIIQRSITGKQLQEAHIYLTMFVHEYETLYYQRRVDRLHFCRPCLHTLLHTAPEAARVGPGACSSQFVMERAIGDLGRDIRQPSNMFGNLCQIALRRSQLNALKSAFPQLDPDFSNAIPKFAHDCGNGFVLLRPRDRYEAKATRILSECELAAVNEDLSIESLCRWGRIRLPNGQVVRSVFSEKRKSERTRISRNVKISLDRKTEFAEVQFLFTVEDEDQQCVPYALVSVYGPPNADLLEDSSHTLWACAYRGDSTLRTIKVSSILSVVSMQPLPKVSPDEFEGDLWFVIEKSGLDDTELTGYVDSMM